jgi:hypothetical protein
MGAYSAICRQPAGADSIFNFDNRPNPTRPEAPEAASIDYGLSQVAKQKRLSVIPWAGVSNGPSF